MSLVLPCGYRSEPKSGCLTAAKGTQHQILRSDLKVSQITRIFVTHMHGDHIYGLMGLLASCGLAGNPSRIDIYGPPKLDEYLRGQRQIFADPFFVSR